MVVQHRFPLLLRKPDPETSISTPVPTRLFQSRFGLFTSPESLFTCPESLFTSSRNLYSHRPGIGIHMPRNTQLNVLDGRAVRTSGLSRQEIRTHLPESRFYSSRRSTRWRGLTLILSADRALRQHPFTVQLSGKAAPPIMRSSCSRASSRAGSEPTTLIGAPHNSERGSRQSLNLPLRTQISRGNARPV